VKLHNEPLDHWLGGSFAKASREAATDKRLFPGGGRLTSLPRAFILSRWLLSVCLAAGLLGCAAPDTEPTFSSPLADRGLSEDDVRIVEAAVRPLLKNPPSAQFRGITAARSDDGHKFVCGWVDYSKPNGALAGEQPFNGTLFAGQFVVGTLARDQSGATKVFADCQANNVPM
jgi:hypothetical protein